MKRIIKLIIALALLPTEQIYTGFTVQAVFFKFVNASFNFVFLFDLFFQAIQQENAADLQLESARCCSTSVCILGRRLADSSDCSTFQRKW